MSLKEFKYGRLLSDFEKGATYEHPWDVTVDGGTIALFASSFQDAMPMFASNTFARAHGFRERPLHPLLCLNLALSFSVHDVSEQAIAHLAYVDVRFPEPGYAGNTVTARSTVIDVKPSSSGDKGVVHVRTALTNEHGHVLCAFERKALIRAGKLDARPAAAPAATLTAPDVKTLPHVPSQLVNPGAARIGFHGFLEDFTVGDVYAHGVGKTVGASEHMMLTQLVRNSHPLHFDELYCKDNSFAKTRVVYGGLVFSWTAALASRDVAGNALWDAGYENGAHPNGTIAGDTLYALSKVLEVDDLGSTSRSGDVKMRLVGVKNKSASAAYAEYGDALFSDELGKKDGQGQGKIKDKVVEVTRTLRVKKR